jgi:apolipoprotein N-acyltransferase
MRSMAVPRATPVRWLGPAVLPMAQLLLPGLSGVLVAATFPPFDHWWLAWIALVPLALSVALAHRILEPLVGALVGGAALHLVALDWIRTSFDGTGLSGPCTIAWLATALFACPAWGATAIVTSVFFHRLLSPMSTALSVGWIAGSLVRRGIAIFFTESDFPWVDLAATQTHWPCVVQVADIVGAIGVGGLAAYVNGMLYDAFAARGHRRLRAVGVPLAFFSIVLLYGTWRLSKDENHDGPTVALMPWDSLPASIADPSPLHGIADILLWPEAVIYDDGRTDAAKASEIARFANSARTHVAIGWHRKRPGFTANSLAVAEPLIGMLAVYDKTYLVPWTEFNPWMRIPYFPRHPNPYRAGTTHPTFVCAETRVAPAICYDACFPGFYRRFERPDMFLVSSAERAEQTQRMSEQIVQIVQLRAVEFRRPVVRGVRGGHSGIIDGCGRLRVDVVNLREPTVVGPVPLDGRWSLYAVFGDWILVPPLAGLLLWYLRNRLKIWRLPRHETTATSNRSHENHPHRLPDSANR